MGDATGGRKGDGLWMPTESSRNHPDDVRTSLSQVSDNRKYSVFKKTMNVKHL